MAKPVCGVLFGRISELSALDKARTAVLGGRGTVVWIEGAPGIGKSALTGMFAQRAAASGCQVRRAAGDELLGSFPLRLMADCLGVSHGSTDPTSAGIAALLRGEPGQSGAADVVLAAAERMLELVDRLCTRGPLVLIAEDLQWADEPSLSVWSRLALAVHQIPLVLVGTVRSAPDRAAVRRLRELAHERNGQVLALGPLDPVASAQLAGWRAGAQAGPRLRNETARAGGNPLYLHELIGALAAEGLLTVQGGRAEFTGDPGTTPRSLTTAIGRRLSFLTDKCRRVLQIAAIMGATFEPGQLAVVSRVPATELAEPLAEALDAGVLTEADLELGFCHPLVQQVLARQIPVSLHDAIQRETAVALAEAGFGARAVAAHLLPLRGGLDDWALNWLCGLDDSALCTFQPAAESLLNRAVQHVAQSDPRWELLAVRLVQVSYWLGLDERVTRLAPDVAQSTASVETAARMSVFAVRSAGRAGRPADAVAAAHAALDRPELPAFWRAQLEAWASVALTGSGRRGEGAAQARQALKTAEASADPTAIAYGHHAASLCANTRAAVEHARRALDVLGADTASLDLRMLLLHNQLLWLSMLARPQEYREQLPGALALAERVGSIRAAGILTAAGDASFLYGAWDESLLYLEQLVSESPAVHETVHALATQALVALHRGQRAEGDARLAAAEAAIPASRRDEPLYRSCLAPARSLRAELDADSGAAYAAAAAWLEYEQRHHGEQFNESPNLVRLALAAGRTEAAGAVTIAAEKAAAAEDLPSSRMAAGLSRAVLEDDVEALLQLAEQCRALQWPLKTGFAFEEAAVRMAARADDAGARTALTEATRSYTIPGAVWDIRRANDRLREFGVRRSPRTASRRASTGWAALTPAELRIAKLVARGWSNPDIAAELCLSRRTVQTHVSNILTKLGLHSRIDVVRALAERGAVSADGEGEYVD
jgi:DNA-binding NarL/FixJ family response regulator